MHIFLVAILRRWNNNNMILILRRTRKKKIRVPDGIWTHGGSWVQIPSGTRIFFSESSSKLISYSEKNKLNKKWYRRHLQVIILKSISKAGRWSALKPLTDPERLTNSSFAEFRRICSKRHYFFYYLALLFYLAYFHHTFSEPMF